MSVRSMIAVVLVLLACLTLGKSASAVVYDSQADFGSVQGHRNWYYGYAYTGGTYNQASFIQFASWGMDPHPEYGAMWYGPGWSRLWAVGGHPNSSPMVWPIRRWVSTMSGTLSISGRVFRLSGSGSQGGDGFTGRILVDGSERYAHYIGPTDTAGANYLVEVPVQIGSYVDFAIDPNGNDGSDHAGFTATFVANEVPALRPTVGLNNRAASAFIMQTAASTWNVKLWGRVSSADGTAFILDDGPGNPIYVRAPGYMGIADGDFASATGILDLSDPRPKLVCRPGDVRKLN